MNEPHVRASLIQVLRRVLQNGTAMDSHVWGPTHLSRWKRWINRLVKYLGIPFVDYGNWREIRVRRVSELEAERIRSVLFELCPKPRCKRCGGFNLDADPAGYYCDAEDHTGAALMCLDHEGHEWKPRSAGSESPTPSDSVSS